MFFFVEGLFFILKKRSILEFLEKDEHLPILLRMIPKPINYENFKLNRDFRDSYPDNINALSPKMKPHFQTRLLSHTSLTSRFWKIKFVSRDSINISNIYESEHLEARTELNWKDYFQAKNKFENLVMNKKAAIQAEEHPFYKYFEELKLNSAHKNQSRNADKEEDSNTSTNLSLNMNQNINMDLDGSDKAKSPAKENPSKSPEAKTQSSSPSPPKKPEDEEGSEKNQKKKKTKPPKKSQTKTSNKRKKTVEQTDFSNKRRRLK